MMMRRIFSPLGDNHHPLFFVSKGLTLEGELSRTRNILEALEFYGVDAVNLLSIEYYPQKKPESVLDTFGLAFL